MFATCVSDFDNSNLIGPFEMIDRNYYLSIWLKSDHKTKYECEYPTFMFKQ